MRRTHLRRAVLESVLAVRAATTAANPSASENAVSTVQASTPTVGEAQALVDKASELRRAGKWSEAVAALNQVVDRFGKSADIEMQRFVATAVYRKGVMYSNAGKHAIALDSFNEVIARYGSSRDAELRRTVAWALVLKGEALDFVGRTKDAASSYDQAVLQFATDPGLQKPVAAALYDKGIMLARSGEIAGAVAAFDELLKRFGQSNGVEVQVSLVMAYRGKAIALEQAGNSNEAIRLYDEALARFGTSGDRDVQRQVAETLFDKGVTLGVSGDLEGAIAAYDQLIARFGSSADPGVKPILLRGFSNKGTALAQLGHDSQAATAFAEGVNRFGASATEPKDKALVEKMRAAEQSLRSLTPARGPTVPTLEQALAAPASDLAMAFLNAENLLLGIPIARSGTTTVVTPEGEINKDNWSTWKKGLEDRLNVYGRAIEQRGTAIFSGNYRLFSVSPSCKNVQSAWIAAVGADKGEIVALSQKSFRIQIGPSGRIPKVSAIAAERSLIFSDPSNIDYFLRGDLSGDRIKIRPDASVLRRWPSWAGPPQIKYQEDCALVLVREAT